MEDSGEVKDQYEMSNDDESWDRFRERYVSMKPEIALEVSTSGKYIARKLRDMGFSIHMADPSKLSIIFNTAKKNDREDSYKLAKLLRLNELPEVHLPSSYSDDLRSLVRYRKSLGEDVNMMKNRVHAILTANGIVIDETDIFGKRGKEKIVKAVNRISYAQRFVISNLIDRITDIMEEESYVEDEISRIAIDDENVKLLMTIPGINVYSAAAVISEIDDISRFDTKEKLASYAGLVPRQDQSGNRDIRGHISKHGPSMLRFILVNAAHVVIKYSKKMKNKYLSLVRRIGKNRSIIAIARILIEIIFVMIKTNTKFVDNIDRLTGIKMKAMSVRARHPEMVKDIEEYMNRMKMVQKERARKTKGMEKINSTEMIT